ncbi:hypothetical protein, partial [Listeria monocytogenes]|uniref:hypothetical protein n=1 Tax=Listeria monocytogenes TaxID=1639 RepID=UPI001C0A9BF3
MNGPTVITGIETESLSCVTNDTYTHLKMQTKRIEEKWGSVETKKRTRKEKDEGDGKKKGRGE